MHSVQAMTHKLLVIPADRISDWIEKGEVLPLYHNPGNMFDEIHILLLHDENPSTAALQSMAGKANIFVHKHPIPEKFFNKTLGWQPFLTKSWEKKVINVVDGINPDCIRCYGAYLNLVLAKRIKKTLNIPYLVSLHINPEENIHNAQGAREKIINFFLDRLERRGLRDADLILPVYEPIVPYLKKRGLKNYKVHYNMVQHNESQPKNDYSLHAPIKILCVGRQFEDKDPSNLMRAVARRNDAQLTIIGKGRIHEQLKALAQTLGVEKFIFIESMDNRQLCAALPDFDIMALHSEYFEFSKVMIESMLAGLPLLVNYRTTGQQIPELSEDTCLRVPATEQGYIDGLEKMLGDHAFREKTGRNAAEKASRNWSLKKTEEQFIKTYQCFLQEAKHV